LRLIWKRGQVRNRTESALALANRKDENTRNEFEKWVVLTFSKNQVRINEKKGADAVKSAAAKGDADRQATLDL
jgi:P pilus assembly chaperone PapD